MTRKTTVLLYACFFASGCVGLIAQVVWTRMLTMTLGSTTYAVSTVLAVFMGGLALGAALFGRWAGRIARPILAYGVMEGTVALYLLATPWLMTLVDHVFRLAYGAVGPQEHLLTLVRIAAAGLFLAPPTLLMGGTLPVLLAAFRVEKGSGGSLVGRLYGANTAGAVCGVFAAGFLLIPLLGLRASLSLASLMGACVLAVALVLARRGASSPGDSPSPDENRPGRAPTGPGGGGGNGLLIATFALTGFCALALEVLWTRILVLHFGSAVYAFSLMLTLFLLGLAAGSFWAARRARRTRRPKLDLAWLAALLAAWVPLQMACFYRFPEILSWTAAVRGASGYGGLVLAMFLAALPLILPPTFLMGATFPLGIRALEQTDRRGPGVLSRSAGSLYAVNTAGTVAGALCAGFFMIPVLGVQGSLVAVGALQALAGLLFLLSRGKRFSPRSLAVPAAGLTALLLCFLFPSRSMLLSAGVFRSKGPVEVKILHYAEDADATVTVESIVNRGEPPYGSISLNGVNVAGSSRDLFAIQKLQGHIPILFRPDARKVLHIGFGSGGTAAAVSLHPVDRIDIAELTRAVPEASDRFFRDINRGVLEDPRVRLIICDGRNYVLATEERYDVILSDSIHPRYSGNGSLYTLEYFRMCRSRLTPNGVCSMWLPFYSLTETNLKNILRAFQDVFPRSYLFYVNSTVNPYTIVVGRNGGEDLDLDAMAERLRDPGVRADLEPILAHEVCRILDYLVVAGPDLARFVGDERSHTDDNLAVEYESARIIDRRGSEVVNLAALMRTRRPARWGIAWGTGTAAGERRRRMEAFYRGSTASLRGHLVYMAGDPRGAEAHFREAARIHPEDPEPDDYFHSFDLPDVRWVGESASPNPQENGSGS